MAGLGIVLAWFGYSVFYYGLNTVTGGNESFMSLIWPGRYAPVPRDSGAAQAASAATSTQIQQSRASTATLPAGATSMGKFGGTTG